MQRKGFSWERHRGPAPFLSSHRAPDRIRDAVPLRNRPPRTDWPQDVMIIGICQKDGAGIIKFRWYTRKNSVLTKEFLVPRGLPGEVVTVEFGKVVEKKYPKGDLDVYVNPKVQKVRRSRYEIRPLCPHYDSCGGCDFLDLRYERQLIEKTRWIQKALGQGKIPMGHLARMRPSTPQQHYAYRMELMFHESDGDVFIAPSGFAPEARPQGEGLHGCILPPRAGVRILSIFSDVFMSFRQTKKSRYSIYNELRSWGTFRSVMVFTARGPPRTDSTRRTEVLLNIVLGNEVEDVKGVLQPLADALVEAAPRSLVGIVANVARSRRAAMGGRREVLLYGRRYVRQSFEVNLGGDLRRFLLEIGAGSRLAAHGGLLRELCETVIAMCGLTETDTLWHCFCSGGELSLALGQLCEHVVAIGTSATEVGELKRNLAANNVSNTTTVLCNLRSPFTLKQLSFHISQSQQQRLLLGTGKEQDKAREYALTCFVPGESRRRQLQRLTAAPFNAPLLRKDALAHQELQLLLPAFVRDFRPVLTTLPVPLSRNDSEDTPQVREVPPEMETRLKRLYRRLALKYHPDKNPNDADASERFQALTRAYKALVGETAGTEEGDEDAVDPFLVAKASSYRVKSKNFWRYERSVRKARPGQESGSTEEGEEDRDRDMDETEAKVAEAFGEDEGENEEWDVEDGDSDIEIEMEIDSAWAQAAQPESLGPGHQQDKTATASASAASAMDVVLHDGDTRLAHAGTESSAPTLPPPDVILCCQPRNRKKGRGTPSYFHSWLRSTAARAIVYVSVDASAFRADAEHLRELGYHVTKVQPFDPEPHRKPVLLISCCPAHPDFCRTSSQSLLLGAIGPGPAPPPPELLRYKKALYLIVVGYMVVLLMSLTAGAFNAGINYVFVLAAAAAMASRSDQCMSTCIVPFFLLAFISLFFDILNVISLLAEPYPGAGNMFSSDCPKPLEATLLKNTTIYLQDAAVNGTAAYTVPANTKVDIPRNLCSSRWVVQNVAMLLGVLLDFVATRVGYRMFKTSVELMQGQGQGQAGLGQQLMMTQQSPLQGGEQPGNGPGGAGGPSRNPRGQGFQPFQGSGQTLSA
ncbi:unnamed protein product [Symbiodinium necroappetens]|uniref:J domain-containing protein n=1 Tax=Symbiodinium necroappetens TaxID=1628268 RepID=A0A812NQZ2_9DINO|nr:unnamed protein product [Symbiodinium necroappetens]